MSRAQARRSPGKTFPLAANMPRCRGPGVCSTALKPLRYSRWHAACKASPDHGRALKAASLTSGDDVMGIFDALNTSVGGLQAQSFALQNISGNIANAQTTGNVLQRKGLRLQ